MLVIIVLIVIVWLLYFFYKTKVARYTYLLKKYKDRELVYKIYYHYFWQGMTQEQLFDSIGKPADIRSECQQSGIKYTYKYNRCSYNRYRTWIYVKNGRVIGWKN